MLNNYLSIPKTIYACILVIVGAINSPLNASICKHQQIHTHDQRDDILSFKILTLPQFSKAEINDIKKVKGLGNCFKNSKKPKKGNNKKKPKKANNQKKPQADHSQFLSLDHSLISDLSKGKESAVPRKHTILQNRDQDNQKLPQQCHFFRDQLAPLNKILLKKICTIKLSNNKHNLLLAQFLNHPNKSVISLKVPFYLCIFMTYWNKELRGVERTNLIKNMLDLSFAKKDQIHILNKNQNKIGTLSIVELLTLLAPASHIFNFTNINNWDAISDRLVQFRHHHPLPKEKSYYSLFTFRHNPLYLFELMGIHHTKYPSRYLRNLHVNITNKSQTIIAHIKKHHFCSETINNYRYYLKLFISQVMQKGIQLEQSEAFKKNNKTGFWYHTGGMGVIIAGNKKKIGIVFKLRELHMNKELQVIYKNHVTYKKNTNLLGEVVVMWIKGDKKEENPLISNDSKNDKKEESIPILGHNKKDNRSLALNSTKNTEDQKVIEEESVSFNFFQQWRHCERCNLQLEPKTKNCLLCSSCKDVRYCSKRCQKIHWKFTHKYECHNIRKEKKKKKAAKKAFKQL